MGIEKRTASRARARLRPAKLFSESGRFLADCAITDRSGHGARIHLFEAADLPVNVILFDESETLAWPTRLVWAGEGDAGLRFLSGAQAVPAADAERIAGRYYAMAG